MAHHCFIIDEASLLSDIPVDLCCSGGECKRLDALPIISCALNDERDAILAKERVVDDGMLFCS